MLGVRFNAYYDTPLYVLELSAKHSQLSGQTSSLLVVTSILIFSRVDRYALPGDSAMSVLASKFSIAMDKK